MIVDTSAILAVYFHEPHGPWAKDQLDRNVGSLRMSTVNLTEALIRIRDLKVDPLADELENRLLTSGIRFIAPDAAQAKFAARARHRFLRLNLGDCFAYALAVAERCPILTVDRDFRVVDCAVLAP